jgi:hypothetical protein
VEWVRALHRLAGGRGLAFVDAPVTGSKVAAANGTLTFLVGAQPDVLERVRPVLERCSATILHLGPPTSGAIFKLINNMMAAVHIAALGEGVAMADKAGLDSGVVMQALGIGAASSPVVKMKLDHIARRDHTDTHFALRWMHKDVTYALQLADELGVAAPTAALTRELLRMAMQRGLGDQDLSVLELARDNARRNAAVISPTASFERAKISWDFSPAVPSSAVVSGAVARCLASARRSAGSRSAKADAIRRDPSLRREAFASSSAASKAIKRACASCQALCMARALAINFWTACSTS